MKVYVDTLGTVVFSDNMHTTERYGPECWIDPDNDSTPPECHEEVDPNSWDIFIAWCKQEGLDPRKADSVRAYMKKVDE